MGLRLFTVAVALALPVVAMGQGTIPRPSAGGDPCRGDGRCAVLRDADGDGDYGDDVQRIINTLAYASLTTASITGETVATSSDRFFGINIDGDPFTASSNDVLNSLPMFASRTGTCTDGGAQSATLNASGTVTGAVTTSGIEVVAQPLNCNDDSCFAGSSGDFLTPPFLVTDVVCSRSGATNVVYTGTGSCTGDASLCTVNATTGSVNITWTAGTGDTTCTYTRAATNTYASTTGIINARWTGAPAGATTCSYTQITAANGGLATTPFTLAPPTNDRTVEWTTPATYCRNLNGDTPEGYTVPLCNGSGSAADDIPTMRWAEEWGGDTEIVFNPTLPGGGAITHAFRMGNESASVDAGNRPGLEMLGAPLFATSEAGVTPGTDHLYLVWLAGIDDSQVKLRMENTGDADNVGLVIQADTSIVELGQRNPTLTATGFAADVVVDSTSTLGLVFAGLDSQPGGYHVRNLYAGYFRAGYKEPALGTESAGNLNGCSLASNAFATCDGLSFVGMGASQSFSFAGIPRDLRLSDVRAAISVEFHMLVNVLGTITGYNGPAYVNCAWCSAVRLHGNSGAPSGVGLLKSDALKVSGVIDILQADAITPDNFNYRNWQTLLAENWLSHGATPYQEIPINSAFQGPGLIDVVGSPDLEWFVDGQGAVAANACAKKRTVAIGGTATLASSCSGYDAFYDSPDKTWVGAVRVRLLENVPSTLTECDLQIEVGAACTACNTGSGEPAAGKVLKYGGTDVWGNTLRNAGDFTTWALNDAVTAGVDVTAEFRPVAGGTACTAGAACTCDGINAVEITVDQLPGTLYDQ